MEENKQTKQVIEDAPATTTTANVATYAPIVRFRQRVTGIARRYLKGTKLT